MTGCISKAVQGAKMVSACKLNEPCMLRKGGEFTQPPSCRQPSAPGKITGRSCAYWGARWMLAPLKDAIHLVHGPVGCAYYGSVVRANAYQMFSTALEEKDIIFGGEKRLSDALIEAKALMPQAKYILVYITCSTALIGDDVDGVCRKMEEKLGCPVITVNCPGFKGESEAAGHRAAYDCLLSRLIGRKERQTGARDVNIIGQYNVHETRIVGSLLSKMGLNVHCVFTGDASYEKIASAHRVRLNLIICQNTGRFFTEAMYKRYGIPYLKVSFFSLSESIDSLRKIGQHFNLEKEAERVIDEEYKAIQPQLAQFLPRLKGKRAAIFLGATHMADLVKTFEDLGMEVVFTGSRFGDAANYKDAWQMVKPGSYIVDDPSERDLEYLLYELRPDVFVGTVKEQSLSHKFGIGLCLCPPQTGAYVGFEGFSNFARGVYKAVYAPVWHFVRGEMT